MAAFESKRCFSMSTIIWVYFGNAISTILTDVVLAYILWQILSRVTFPGSRHEKLGVGISFESGGTCSTSVHHEMRDLHLHS